MDNLNTMASDFVVISGGTSGSIPSTPSPENPSKSAFELSLLAQRCPESDVQRLARDINKVSEKNTSLRRSLSENRNGLERVRSALTAKEAEILAKTDECESLQIENRQLKDELTKLQNRQEEWEQTRKDYLDLKNNYNLLTNTKLRLQSEKEDLIKTKDSAVAEETGKVRAKFELDLKNEIESERSKFQLELQAVQKNHDAEMQDLKLKLEAERKEAIDSLEGQISFLTTELETTQINAQEELKTQREKNLAATTRLVELHKEELQKVQDDNLAELDGLVKMHKENLQKIRDDYEEKVKVQIALVCEANRLLAESTCKHEAEKNELLEQLNQTNMNSLVPQQSRQLNSLMETDDSIVMCFNNGSVQMRGPQESAFGRVHADQAVNSLPSQATFVVAAAEQVRAALVTANVGVGTEPRAGTGNRCQNPSFEAAQNRPPVQEQESAGSLPPQATATVDAAVGTLCVSVANSDSSARASIPMAESAMATSREVQTDEIQLEFQVANSEHLQGESAIIRNLKIQISTLAIELRNSRSINDQLTFERNDLRSKLDDLGRASGADQHKINLLEQKIVRLTEDHRKKTIELDSVLMDFDETRNELYKRIGENKDQQAVLNLNKDKIEELKQRITELESQSSANAALSDVEQLQQPVANLNAQVLAEKERHQSELEELRKELESKQSAGVQKSDNHTKQLEHAVTQLTDQLKKKQLELDSVLMDFDETRNELYKRIGENKDQQVVLKLNENKIEELKQRITELESQSSANAALSGVEQLVANLNAQVLAEKERHQSDLEELRKELESKQSAGVKKSDNHTKQLEHTVTQLTDQLNKKQLECDSLVVDLDGTRNKLCETQDQLRDLAYTSNKPNAQVEKLKQKNRDLEAELHQLKVQHLSELENIRKQKDCHQHSVKLADQAMERQQMSRLSEKLDAKQADCESLIKDLDETRNLLCETRVKSEEFQSRLTAEEMKAEKLRQKIRELETDIEQERKHKELELETVRKENQFKETKVCSAEKEAERLKQEVEKLQTVEDELRGKLRENQKTMEESMNNYDQEIKSLKSTVEANLEALAANARNLERQGALEMQLRDAISDLVGQLKRKAEDTDQKMLDENRKQERLYNRMCDQSEQRAKAEQQLNSANKRLELTEQHLRQAKDKLASTVEQLENTEEKLRDSETFVVELQNYSETIGAQLQTAKQQLQDSTKKRDTALQMAEQMRFRLDDEVRRYVNLTAELDAIKQENTKARADYSEMEQNFTSWLAKEHELNTQLENANQQLQHRQHEVDQCNHQLRDKQEEVNRLINERDMLQDRVNRLIKECEAQQPQEDLNATSTLLSKHRKGSNQGGGNR